MKELSIEEKAKRYDEAIEELRGLLEGIHEEKCDIMEEDIIKIFPELKESEDEMIRKELLSLIEWSKSFAASGITFDEANEMIAWLEKQGNLMKALKISNSRIAELVEEKYNLEEKLEKQGEQKPYGQRQECLDCQFNYAGECKGSCTMKRDEQKPAWSEEDEITRKALINLVEMYYGGCIDKTEKNRLLNFLKSLRPQSRWKPSDKQIKALDSTLQYNKVSPNSVEHLNSLFNDLKKLKE